MTKPRRQKRRVFDLCKRDGVWALRERRTSGFTGKWNLAGETRDRAIRATRTICRELHAQGDLVQLVVRNTDGTISFENTYGADPKRSKG